MLEDLKNSYWSFLSEMQIIFNVKIIKMYCLLHMSICFVATVVEYLEQDCYKNQQLYYLQIFIR